MIKTSFPQIESALQEWVRALDVIEDPIFMHDGAFRILRCNRAYQQLADLPFEQILGRPYFKVFPRTEGAMPHCLNTLRDGTPDENEDEISVAGTLFRSRSYAIRNAEGGYLYSIHILEDITDRQQTEEMLLSEKRFSEKLIESIPDIFYLLDDQGKLARWNKKIEKLFGMPSERLKGRDALKFIYGPDRPEIGRKIQETFRGSNDVTEARVLTKQGVRYYMLTSNRIRTPEGRGIIGIGVDITERREAELQLQRERDFSDKLIDAAPAIILILDPKGHIVRYNRYMEQLCGYALEEVRGKEWFSLFLPEANRERTREIFLEAIHDMDTQGQIDTLLTRGGDTRQIEWYSKTMKGSDNRTEGLLAIGMDVTEQRKVQERLELFHTLFEHSRDAVEIIEPETLKLLDVNETLCRELDYGRDELIGMTVYDINPTIAPDVVKSLETTLRKEGSLTFESLHRRRNGSTYPVEISLSFNNIEPPCLLAIARDITERKEAEEALKDSEEKFRTMTASAQDAILMMDENGKISYWNEAAERMFGYSADEAMGQVLHHFLAPERFLDAHQEGFRHFQRTGEGAAVGKTLELAAVRKDGSELPIELSMSSIRRKDRWGAIGIIRNISDRKASEAALVRANRALKTLSSGNLALVRATSEKALLKKVTKVIVEKGGYDLAVVDFATDDTEKRLDPVAWAGFKGRRYWIESLTWGHSEHGNTPAGRAVREKTTQICRDISSEPFYDQWREAATAHGYVSNIALPLFNDGRIFGALSIYSSHAEPFDGEEVKLLEELSGDLAYGILSQRTRAAHEKHEALLREGLEQTIQAIAATVEMRDPYTAGHQKRVAELATAIAREMGLGKEQTEGIRFAAVIHDLGKVHVPAEILSKPGKLTDLEYQLIQTHPQAGYDIIKDVRFPWPIADIILQHHERLDGSGYPQGLTGNEILLEARIIAVADTVEAISSHRPYRSALGMTVAMEEIRKGRGTYYDRDVVDACTRLCEKKGFSYSGDTGSCPL